MRRLGQWLHLGSMESKTTNWSTMIEQIKYLFGRMFAKRTLDPDIVQTPKYIFYRRTKAFTAEVTSILFRVIMVAIEWQH
jgi:hypothetical protein